MRDDSQQNHLQPQLVPIADDDPHRADHELLVAFQRSLTLQNFKGDFGGNEFFEAMTQLPPSRTVDLIVTALARLAYFEANPPADGTVERLNISRGTFPLYILVKTFLAKPMELTSEDMERLMECGIGFRDSVFGYKFPMASFLLQLEQFESNTDLMAKWQPQFRQLRQNLSPTFCANVGADYHYGGNRAMQKLAEILGTQLPDFLERGDA